MNAKNTKNNVPQGKKDAGRQGGLLPDDDRMPMDRHNYALMAIGFFVIVLGFVLMTGGGDNNPDVFDAGRIYSFRRITLAPILVLGGFVLEIYAIMSRRKSKKEQE